MECMSAYPQPLYIYHMFLWSTTARSKHLCWFADWSHCFILTGQHLRHLQEGFQGVDTDPSNPLAAKDISCLIPVKHFEHDKTSWYTGGSELVQTCMGSSMWTQHHMHWFLHLCGHNPLIPTLHSCGMRFWGRKDLGDQMTEPAMWQKKRDAQKLTNSRSANMSILKKNKKQQHMYSCNI